MHIKINNNYLTYDKYRVKCALGKRGINKKKREGDLVTPKGLFKMKYVLFRKDRVKKLKTKLKKIAIQKDMGWCNDSRSTKYNKLIKKPFNYTFEKLYKKNNTYDIIIVLNYNSNPVVKNKGSAIFIHVAKKNYKKTEGCIALKKKDLLKLLTEIKTSTKVMI